MVSWDSGAPPQTLEKPHPYLQRKSVSQRVIPKTEKGGWAPLEDGACQPTGYKTTHTQ